jgi:hypothetical protein
MRLSRDTLVGLVAGAVIATPLVVVASSVTLPNLFTNGTTADATEVNANFNAVKAAIDDNDGRLTALETSGGGGAAGLALGPNTPGFGADGDLFYNTTANTLLVYSDGFWRRVGGTTVPVGATECDAFGNESGAFEIDHDDDPLTPDVTLYCDNDTDGGGWTRVFFAGTDNLSSTSITYDANTDEVRADATEMMFAFFDTATGTISQPWKFPIPESLRNTAPMQAGQCEYETIDATRIEDGSTVTKILRFGWGSFSNQCDDSCSSTWGQICLKDNAIGVGGGHSDFPAFHTFAVGNTDHCVDSSQTYSSQNCTTSKRFAIFVR